MNKWVTTNTVLQCTWQWLAYLTKNNNLCRFSAKNLLFSADNTIEYITPQKTQPKKHEQQFWYTFKATRQNVPVYRYHGNRYQKFKHTYVFYYNFDNKDNEKILLNATLRL